ncbi:MAG: rRNA adenine N-6-methyltransferase family protein [Veillonella sp.]
MSRTVFVPAPNVDSAILQMVRRPEPAVAVKDEDFFFSVSKASFVHRRKTLWNNLTSRFGKTEEIKPNWKEDSSCRPATFCTRRNLSKDFARLADSF